MWRTVLVEDSFDDDDEHHYDHKMGEYKGRATGDAVVRSRGHQGIRRGRGRGRYKGRNIAKPPAACKQERRQFQEEHRQHNVNFVQEIANALLGHLAFVLISHDGFQYFDAIELVRSFYEPMELMTQFSLSFYKNYLMLFVSRLHPVLLIGL